MQRNYLLLFAFVFAMFTTTNVKAQSSQNDQSQQVKLSTKILQDNGLDEVYDVITQENGYLLIGLKGTTAESRNLWLVTLDKKMKVTKSETVHNIVLTAPLKHTLLENGEIVILGLEYDFENNKKESILFHIGRDNSIIGSKRLANSENIYYSAIASKQDDIFLAGIDERNPLDTLVDYDKLSLLKLNSNLEIVKSTTQDLKGQKLLIKNMIVDHANSIIITGAASNLNNFIKSWVAMKYSRDFFYQSSLQLLHQYDYNNNDGIIETIDGYMAVISDESYYGKSKLISLDYNFHLISSQSFEGTSVMLTGIKKVGDKEVISAIFSNGLQSNAPGCIILDGKKIIAKRSTTQFNYFFTNSIASFGNQQFMISGTGYANNNASDIYMMPFTKDGETLCDFENVKLRLKDASADATRYRFACRNSISGIDGVVSNITQDLVISNAKYQLNNICTLPDEEQPKTDWSKWQKDNAEVFKFEIPKNWITVSPNPNKGIFTINYLALRNENLQILVYNTKGSLLKNLSIANQDRVVVDLSDQLAGNYFIKVFDGHEAQIVQVVIEK